MILAAAFLAAAIGPRVPAVAENAAPAAGTVARAIASVTTLCENWRLDRARRSHGDEAFLKETGLAAQGVVVQSVVPDFALPPPTHRTGLHHFGAPFDGGVIFVSVSDQSQICHGLGGSGRDMQPEITKALVGRPFVDNWVRTKADRHDALISESYKSKRDASLTILITYSEKADDRTDRPQFAFTSYSSTGK